MSPKTGKDSDGYHHEHVKCAERVDVLVVGAGMVGLAFASALKDSGLKVTLIERGEPAVFESLGMDCRVSAIVLGNQQILQGLGAWKHLQADAGAMHSMRIWDDQHPGGIRFDADEISEGDTNYAALGYLVQNSHLQAALKKTLLPHDNVEILCPTTIRTVEWLSEHVQITLQDGHRLIAPLIVGADGAHSWLREQADIGVYSRDYNQSGIVANVRSMMPHHGTAFQRFTASGPLAMLPMGNGLCSIVWSQFSDDVERLMALDDIGFLEELNLTFGPMLGRIEEVGKRAAFPLKARLAIHLVRPRLALIGDAAHTIHPLAGLGVNLGLRDAMVLAQEIVDAKKYGEDWGDMSVLNRYMKLRMPDILSVMGSMEGLHRIFTSQLPGLPMLRGLGMKALGNASIIKSLLMRNSTGLTLPVPKQVG
ncbi:MAG: UbiH/UbiF/VisC/COQ6 family ubiquinone biosynthesis hydroxylase [Mariprofundaceae bacterium]|nr:UbiH/UbiF/VisC/COQ6 family ubiquinone biosynthesis hydroxylase [Mariprofundaceae bacterium]